MFKTYIENYGTARPATNGNMIGRMRIACRIIKARKETRTQNM